ncbi:hypothetical protein PF005_g22895 [Phytophthora fragariae]|uniref:Peptidase S74 domain-containing protein n=1 Tax=Phytophthora fragariae TaxID=53985 RepID=A0A6A4C5A4_9STRA|nr:hypothetical protein PF011_g21451 [Phytophthora fragariae]KAE9081366.1 hypothetical protein PF007_g22689 [Phytophthora fragariae]KAE9103693.1 hypothetical protein PF006_g22104 [Phytophthora fragariae]KAE9181417.1 hypothetical protein PF005_g22895 [Phytophthora fragariae]KAE9191376.1 hypothetical protein PF004_g21621 [Phytophthora fragariae]
MNATTLNINPTTLQIKGTTLNATGTELNKLSGCTATTAELNYLDLTSGAGTAEASKALVLDSNSTISSGISSLTSTNLISTTSTQCQIAAGTSFTSTTRASDFNLIIRNQSNTVGAQVGLSFTIEGTSDMTTYTPSVNLYCTRTATSAQYSMADFAISTRSSSNALSPMTERMRITQAGYIRFGSATSTAKLDITSSANLISGSWQRAMRILNDQATPIEFEVQIYNDVAGGANGVALGTTTTDPLRFMVNNTTRMYLNSSARLGVDLGPSWSPEATIHSGGEVWANTYMNIKGNGDGFARYRFNWSQTDYPVIGTDATIGAIRIGKCDANYNWTAYVPVRGGSYTNASDVRLKADIVDCPYGLASLMKMRPRKFRMVQEHTTHVGFIAQEIESVGR